MSRTWRTGSASVGPPCVEPLAPMLLTCQTASRGSVQGVVRVRGAARPVRASRHSARRARLGHTPKKRPAAPRPARYSHARVRGSDTLETAPKREITPRPFGSWNGAVRTSARTKWSQPSARWSSLVTPRRLVPSPGSVGAPVGPVHSCTRSATADPIGPSTLVEGLLF